MAADPPGMFTEIPVIDVSPLLDDTEAGLRRVAKEIDDAYSRVGFGYITNHGIAQNTLPSACS